jgi:hypothetical protein
VLKEKPLVIIARGVSLWLEAVKELKDYKNVIVLFSPASGYLSENNLKFKDSNELRPFEILNAKIKENIK